jgi:hypothetical protein
MGYDITVTVVLDAYAALMVAAGAAGVDETVVKADVLAIIAGSGTCGNLVLRVLNRQLTE